MYLSASFPDYCSNCLKATASTISLLACTSQEEGQEDLLRSTSCTPYLINAIVRMNATTLISSAIALQSATCSLRRPRSRLTCMPRLSIVSLRHSVCRLGVCRCITKSIADHHNQMVVASMGESYIAFDIDPIRNGLDLMAVTKWRFKGSESFD